MLASRPYKVVESDTFREHVGFLIGDFRHWDAVTETIMFDLARRPLVVPAIEGTELRALVIAHLGRAVYYTVDEEARTITLEALF